MNAVPERAAQFAFPQQHKPEGRSWHVHIGAHKTATTHLQDCLTEAEPQISAAGGAVLLPSTLRPWADAMRWRPSGVEGVRHALRRRYRLPGRVQAGVSDRKRIVASEEDILGQVADLLCDPIYPDLSCLDLLKHSAKREPLTLYVSVRSYDTLLTSAFFELLRVRGDAKALIDARVRAFDQGAAGWPQLFARIRDRVPQATVRFWRYETYVSRPEAIVSALAGCPLPGLALPANPERTRSPAISVLAEVDALDPDLPHQERFARVREIYRAHPATTPPQVLDPDTSERLASRYRADLEALKQSWSEISA